MDVGQMAALRSSSNPSNDRNRAKTALNTSAGQQETFISFETEMQSRFALSQLMCRFKLHDSRCRA